MWRIINCLTVEVKKNGGEKDPAASNVGILTLLISVWQYRRVVRYLWSEPYRPLAGIGEQEMRAPVFALALLLVAVGVFAFIAIIVRAV